MANNNREIEIKLAIDSMEKVITKLKEVGAKYLGVVKQNDILWDYSEEGKTFDVLDQALRLRIEKDKKGEKAILTFKGTPHIDKSGTKSRDEFNSEVSNPNSVIKILKYIGFYEAVHLVKRRRVFSLDNVECVIDELKFGNYMELEGSKKDIDKLMRRLNLEKFSVELKPYHLLQCEWEKAHEK
ncbi:MAG: Adenylyl cyclase CyaB [Candidatus Woesebacteria bacterium GW2011_GWB1_39_12]|uniref:Adenylyl cyclase CyaB n=2 Tax=Candidatus Woeseibacteriota TaxID=1752722 RepID=A0A0G0MAX1_9BACT|nr:MAG: Adenylyl cyclase CyaB [Candidatus Woesebacteria bacterium GW2011_GWA1_39_12]KKR00353.1 MAG: Adenylyl cyclase CyaB [Candidatus Woesebacteria bacterium GW2011_GWB1_39_12]